MTHIRDVFDSPADLLRLEPEELAGVLLEVIPDVSQRGMFVWQSILELGYPSGGNGWPRGTYDDVALAVAEAFWRQSAKPNFSYSLEPSGTQKILRATGRSV